MSQTVAPRADVAVAPPVNGTAAVAATVEAKPRPYRRRSRKRYYAIIATQGEVTLPPHKPLGYLTQSKLISQAQQGDVEAKRTVWERNVRLALSVANRCRTSPQAMADLIQAGQIGLARAIEKFEVERLNDFSTYAYHWVRNKVQLERLNNAFATRVPVYLYAAYCEFRTRVAGAQSGREWYDARDEWLSRDARQYATLRRFHAVANPQPLEAVRDTLAIDRDPSRRLCEAESVSDLRRALAMLPRRERLVLEGRYGLDGGPEQKLDDIGQALGLTRERIRQIQVRAEINLVRLLIQRKSVCLPDRVDGSRICCPADHPSKPPVAQDPPDDRHRDR